MLGNLLKATIGTVLLPIDVLKDVGDIMADGHIKEKSHTGKAIEDIADELDEVL